MHSIRTRLFLVLSATGIFLVLAAAALYQFSFERAMQDYLDKRERYRVKEFSERLADYYVNAGGWPEGPAAHPRPGLRIPPHLILLDAERRPVAGGLPPSPQVRFVPVKVNERKVGWLGYQPREARISDGIDRSFEARQWRTLLLTTCIALLIALLGSWFVSRYLVQPITAIAAMSRRMANGDYSRRLDTGRRDELGALSRDINHLAGNLERAARARDRWLADISHELRTPLAILQGEIEALVDGIRPADPKRLESLHQEILHLRRLIDDLHDLALADAGTLRYRMEQLDLADLIEEQASLFEDSFRQRHIDFTRQMPETLPINGDATRLRQLLANLLHNSTKYTDTGGEARLRALRDGQRIVVTLEDSAPGVPEEALERLFDHLYRAETASRNREFGGSGLGLALARRIVEAHDGDISASASPLGGLCLRVSLPAADH